MPEAFTLTPRLYEQALGAYLGLAVGDALGATVEFMTPREIRARHGVHRDITGGGWLKLQAGQVTDDTTMSLALGEALLQGHRVNRPWDTALVADAFVRWWRGKPVDCGNTCRRGIARYDSTGVLAGPPQEGDGGNGALMRNLPVALATVGQPERLQAVSLAQAHITHHHPLSDAALLAFGQWLHAIWLQPDARLAQVTLDSLATAWVQAWPAFRFQPYPGRASGYVVDTVQTVLHFAVGATDFESAVVGAVNQGDDADTTGALVGMLLGAIHGAGAIPPRWLHKLDAGVRWAIVEQTSALLAWHTARPVEERACAHG
ncbi:MAG: ADP-ribosyl-[dinitrogen reductase] glycohydrolase DraG [Pseudomonadota bacterium]